jgi:hypothetical protein
VVPDTVEVLEVNDRVMNDIVGVLEVTTEFCRKFRFPE